MPSDLDIARAATRKPIEEIASELGLGPDSVELYGKYKAKITPDNVTGHPGKLILVTAINPTPAGEGKTTTTVGLADGLRRLGKKTVAALRQPSLGPVFGVKGGAAGGGYAQVLPMEDINLHFTGDFHAIGAAHNLLAALLDAHIYHGNELAIRRTVWRRCVDMNDRQLRNIVSGLGAMGGVPREDGFDITAASEVMACLCLADSLNDLKQRLGRIIVGYTAELTPVTAADLKAHGAMTVLLRDALRPNLAQTLEHTPVFIHGGPFANIAHGCNSVTATRLALQLGDYCVTEAGFGADLGAEKFFDIKCRAAGLSPSAVVVVATIRALKFHGGAAKAELASENVQAVQDGLPNLLHHVQTVTDVYGLPVVVALNRFATDTQAELACVRNACAQQGIPVADSEVHARGGAGALDLAREVVRLCEQPNTFRFAYSLELSIEEKLNHIVQKVYGGTGVTLTPTAKKQASQLEALGYGNLPICPAKTQYSLSDNPSLMAAPRDFSVTVRALRVSAGAGFVVALTGDILTMPGLSKSPAAQGIDVDANGDILGLF